MLLWGVAAFRITIADDQTVSEGEERHATYERARASAVRSAVAILMDRKGQLSLPLFATCEIRNDRTNLHRTFDVTISIGSDRRQ
jgi:hypothetical protein